MKRREGKGKGEKERYTHLNAEFQRIARRNKKALLSDQCKEIEENNRMGKARDIFKKLEIPREHFMQRWGTIKDRNGRDLTEEEENFFKGGKNTQNYTKKDLHDPDNHGSVTTHLEPDIPESKVRWALGSITLNKASGGDGIPAKLLMLSMC